MAKIYLDNDASSLLQKNPELLEMLKNNGLDIVNPKSAILIDRDFMDSTEVMKEFYTHNFTADQHPVMPEDLAENILANIDLKDLEQTVSEVESDLVGRYMATHITTDFLNHENNHKQEISAAQVQEILKSTDLYLLAEITAHYLDIDIDGKRVSVVPKQDFLDDLLDFDFVNSDEAAFIQSLKFIDNDNVEFLIYNPLDDDSIELQEISAKDFKKAVLANSDKFLDFFNNKELTEDFYASYENSIANNVALNNLLNSEKNKNIEQNIKI